MLNILKFTIKFLCDKVKMVDDVSANKRMRTENSTSELVDDVSANKRIRTETATSELCTTISDISPRTGKESLLCSPTYVTSITKDSKNQEVTYDPAHFIRCHGPSKYNKGTANSTTQVWDVSFEPDHTDPTMTTNSIATCGGNSICVTDVVRGEVLMKYRHADRWTDFYTLTWTVLPHEDGTKKSVLLSGSSKGDIFMFYPEEKICFYIWTFVQNILDENEDEVPKKKQSNIAVNSIIGHSKNKSWIFVGLSSGVLYLYDIGRDFLLPQYEHVDPQQLLKLEPYLGEIYNVKWTGNESQWLIAGAKAGMVGWRIEEEKILDSSDAIYTPVTVDFQMPRSASGDITLSGSTVDSIDVINDFTLVCKCVSHGFLYVINLSKTIDDLQGHDKSVATRAEKEAKIIAKLDWSKTDTFYMNIGCNRQGLICCGDDDGSLWVYEQPKLLEAYKTSGLESNEKDSSILKANVRLMWPSLEEASTEISESNLENGRRNITIDKVDVSYNGDYIVAVTSNNMICIWKRKNVMLDKQKD